MAKTKRLEPPAQSQIKTPTNPNVLHEYCISGNIDGLKPNDLLKIDPKHFY